ncbi:PD-(D/E)XK nuclease family protein [Rubrivirga marina]|uniref:PD-(D/E)XK endonuclease-like domain-containing protein n=1 Tax=Rubrivirga marina TaxID=1196024 RepID=A0A271ITB8_9BACT|nr:PD-(D/E)XK nuclease family protein [Rubrivirga marina]PAP74168.1 hypothetical protein BSZ37_21120 [Rubrivirga marina]
MTPSPLPPPVRSVVGPDALSASGLGRASQCPLSAALDADPDAPRLPVHPRALYGRVLHRLVEAAARGQVDDRDGFARGARRAVDALLAELPERTPAPQRVLGALEWRRRRADAVAVARSVAGKAPVRRGASAPARSPDRPEPWTVADGRWTEVVLRSDVLRVTGRADLVERSGDLVRISDLKTGSPTTSDGTVRASVVLQLRAYGLVAAERLPSARIELRVVGTSSFDVSFNEGDRDAALRTIRSVSDQLPPSRHVSAADLARPGAACGSCRHRHRCGPYLASAPSWWRDGEDFPFPLDLWGTVESVRSGGETSDLVLRDPTGRRVRVAGLRAALARDLEPGDALFAFGFDEPTGRRGPSWRPAPLVLRDLDPDTGAAAWSLAVFGPPLPDVPPLPVRSPAH